MKRGLVIAGIIIFAGMLAGCGNKNTDVNHNNLNKDKGYAMEKDYQTVEEIKVSDTMQKLDEGFRVIRYEGNDGFEEFLRQGGAASDSDVAEFLTQHLMDSGI